MLLTLPVLLASASSKQPLFWRTNVSLITTEGLIDTSNVS